MKTIHDVLKAELRDIPNDYICCSVCGGYFSPDHFRKAGEDRQSRTNCTSCYNLPWEDMQKLKEETKQLVKSNSYKNKKIRELLRAESESITVEDMIEKLSKLPAGSRLLVTQEGYYADGKLGDIHDPEPMEDYPGYYSIGHSSQNY